MVLEQNLQLKESEFNELAERHENLRVTNSKFENAQQRQHQRMGQLNLNYMDISKTNEALKEEIE